MKHFSQRDRNYERPAISCCLQYGVLLVFGPAAVVTVPPECNRNYAGDKKLVFAELEQSYIDRDSGLPEADALIDSLHDDPWQDDLLKRINLNP
jgi:hypothetical protein